MHVSLTHWFEGLGWEMVEGLFKVVQARTNKVVMLPLISLSLAMKTQC